MKAVYFESFAPKGSLKVGQLPVPTPCEGEVLIAVSSAGVNPADWKIVEGLFQSRMPHQFPLIPGWEASGFVHSLGPNVTSLKEGDKVYVYCRKPVVQWGSWAEYLTFPAEHVAIMPKNLSMIEAAAIPLAGLTAWQALFDKVQLKAGEQILVHAGGGGVGGFAIQWAKWKGARVTTTASASKREYVQQFNPDAILDYQKVDFVEAIRQSHPQGIDVVLDTLGGSIYRRSFEVLKPGGRIVSILEEPDADLMGRFGVRAEFLFVSPNRKQLQEIAALFETGKAKAPKIQEFPLDQAAKAMDAIKKGHTSGKIVLKVRD